MRADAVMAALLGIHRTLNALQRGHVLVGGLAVSVRARPRLTRDVDLAVGVESDADAEALVRDLRARGYEIVALVEQEAVDRLATARLVSPEGVVVDLLFATSGLEEEAISRAETIEVDDDISVPVVRAEELLAMKILSMCERREQDARDARWLLEVNPDIDLDAVRANLELIRTRGFDRGEHLAEKLGQMITTAVR